MKCGLAIVALCFIGLGASPPATTQPSNTRVDVRQALVALASDDVIARQTVERALVRAYPWQGEEIEAVAKRTDLDPKAAAELRQFVSLQKARVAAGVRAYDRGEAEARANHSSALAAYEKVGHRDPAWDATVRGFLEAYIRIPHDPALFAKRQEKLTELRDALKKAGCDDPLIRYFLARSRDAEADRDLPAAEAELRDAVQAIEKSDYPAQRKCWAHAKYVEFVLTHKAWEKVQVSHDAVEAELDRAVELWPEMVKSDGVTDSLISGLAAELEDAWTKLKSPNPQTPGDRAALCDKLFPAWSAARPNDPGPWVYKGTTYVNYAWDARGSCTADTVTEDGWRLMAERLAVAREALEHAYTLDPADPRAATEMLTVELGSNNDRGAMELWWTRAMEANPDNMEACEHKLYYLEPKWHGSPQAMIDFGRTCLKAGNWEGRLPFILMSAHRDVSAYTMLPDLYYRQPAVWSDVRAVYEPYLTWFPQSTWDRCFFAYYATRCGQWDVARKQFEILGDNPSPLGGFETKEQYDEARRRATAAKGP